MKQNARTAGMALLAAWFTLATPAGAPAAETTMSGSQQTALYQYALVHDQSSLAEYLQHLRIDPNKVVVVDVNPKADPQNPRVTVFYRR